ncbi:HAD family hydrolase [Phaeacidiphilus oryzae]|uniref:HAD family hydrolase n=1 Tax=Phaeacidiphilus oryzae TaxID=348818 RepID=UPI000569AE4E|nr:HAD family hydrolase [Phaeacidiphilus oryzae]
MPRIRGVLFDLDDTLHDYTASDRAGLIEHLRVEGLLERFADPAEAYALWRRIMDEEYARFLAGELTFTAQRATRTRRFLARADPARREVPEADALDWFARYAALRDAAWRAFPDAEPALRALTAGHRLGVVSNSSTAHQLGNLRATGLLRYFADGTVVCSAEHGAAKPAESIFHAGCAALGLPPHQVAYVGDRYDLDAVGARDAGLHAYWLDRSGAGPDGGADAAAGNAAIQVIRSLAELPTALRALGDAG